MKPLYGFSGKRIELVRVITLPVLFGTLQNPHTEYITFDIVDMLYPIQCYLQKGPTEYLQSCPTFKVSLP
jgi:hypothetical protein